MTEEQLLKILLKVADGEMTIIQAAGMLNEVVGAAQNQETKQPPVRYPNDWRAVARPDGSGCQY